MSLLKAKRLFSSLALFSVVFNNLATPLYVYAEDLPTGDVAQEQSAEPVVTEPTPTVEETVTPSPEATPTEIVEVTPATEATEPAVVETTPEESQPTNEGAQSQAPPTETATESPAPGIEVITPEGNEKLQVNVIEDVQAVSIDFMDIKYNPDGTASITTDKLDYAPTDAVVITGTGFNQNTEYDLIINGTGDFNYIGTVTSNDKGEILYSYQLDGTYRPEYTVEIKKDGIIFANAYFTDADTGVISPTTNVNVGWSNPQDAYSSNNNRAIADNGNDVVVYGGFSIPAIPSGQGITGIEVMIEGYTTRTIYTDRQAEISLSWDGGTTYTSGANGVKTTNVNESNSGTDSVSYYGGTSDLWGRVEWTTTELSLANFKVKVDTIPATEGTELKLDHVAIKVYYDSKVYWCHCAASGECNTLHLPMSALINAGHVNASGNPLHAGDYAGQCTQKGTIVVKKVTNPNTDTTTQFSFTGNAGGIMRNGDQINWGQQNPGSYTMTETDPTSLGYELESISCNDGKSQTPSTWDLQTRTVYLNLDAGENLECTFTNKRLPAKFTIGKYIDNDGDISTDNDITDGSGWTFRIYEEGAAPQLMATGQTGGDGQVIISPFYPTAGKTYKVVEQSVVGFVPMLSLCRTAAAQLGQGGSNGEVTGIPVGAGANIICDFFNKPEKGKLTIIKDTKPDNTENFVFRIGNQNGEVARAVLDDDGETRVRSNTATFDLVAGSYIIDEFEEDGGNEYALTNVSCTGTDWQYDGQSTYVTVSSGQEVTCTFTNTEYGKIYGHKFNDKDGDMRDDFGENDLSGWTIYLDENKNGRLDPGERTDITDRGGDYSFDDLLPGEYQVCEIQQHGWISSLPHESLCQRTTINTSGGDWDEINFGNHGVVTLKAYKIVCPSEATLPNWGNGVWWSVDSGTANWFLSHHFGCYYQDNWEFQWGYGGENGVDSVPGNTIGYAPNTGPAMNEWKHFMSSTDNVPGGQLPAVANIDRLYGVDSLWVREVLPSTDWLPFSDDTTWPRNSVSAEMYCSGDILNYDNYDRIDNPLYGETYYCVAFNTFNKGGITGTKWEDVDGDGERDEGENPIAGWVISARDSQNNVQSVSTNASGVYEFSGLTMGNYEVCEQNQTGYVPVSPSNGCRTVTVTGGQTSRGNDFYNQPVRLGISIEKSNVLNTSNGTVEYTIKVTNTGNQDFNTFEIHDALPGGFTYISGSSTLEDGLIADPVFTSGEAKWDIQDGGIAVGQTLTLKYRASIDSSLPAGVYTNFAYAVGKYIYPWAQKDEPSITPGDQLVARTLELEVIVVSDFAYTNIVDSAVLLTSSVSYGGRLAGQVLGASTEVLPATGSETWVIMLATALVVVGFASKGAALIIEERKRKNA